MSKIEDADSLQQLGEVAVELAANSMKQYQEVATQAWELITGVKEMDRDALAKGYTTWIGTMARDVGNAMTITQQAVKLATAPKDDGASTSGTAT
jgi:hypothetical protein